MSVSGVLYAIAALLFLLAAFGATIGDDVNLMALGLTFLAAGLAAAAFGVGAHADSKRLDR